MQQSNFRLKTIDIKIDIVNSNFLISGDDCKTMYFLFWVIILSIGLGSCTSSNDNTDLNKQNINGSVEKIVENRYKPLVDDDGNVIPGDRITEDMESDYTIIYNKEGNIEEMQMFQSGVYLAKYAYKYDENGALIEKLIYDSENAYLGRESYIYYETDQGADVIEYSESDKKDKINRTWMSIYRNNILLENKYFRGKDNFKSRTLYEYDEIGREISRIEYDKEGKEFMNFQTTYDDKSNSKEVLSFDKDEVKWKVVRFYDSFENEIKSVYLYYDSNYSKINEYKYIYDEMDNWIVKIKYVDGAPTLYLERIISYF